jgi:hypothetical protein
MVDNRSGWIDIGIFTPNPAFDCLADSAFALDLSASATFSAVNSGTAGIGLPLFPNVMILGWARTETGTGAAAKIADA